MLRLLQNYMNRFFPLVRADDGRVFMKTAAVGGALGMVLLLVPQLEGLRLGAYLDSAGIPTICYGHTASVRMGQTRSEAECAELLKGDLGVALAAVRRNVHQPIPESMEAALASFTYNVGVTAFEHSTLLRLVNQGQFRDACAQMKRWNCEKAPAGLGDKTGNCKTAKRNKRFNKGLAKRRDMEVAVCLRDI
ncbi:MAG: lysozyme [Alphaproteobacteria bacterium]|nr:lysozyme [Alphaproteobacteria bacterium]